MVKRLSEDTQIQRILEGLSEEVSKIFEGGMNMRIWVEVDGERIEVVDERISEMVKEYLKKRMQKENEYEFEFEATNDPRKGYPYVAKIVLRNGLPEREFYELPRFYGKKTVTVKGTYRAKEGDVLEIQEGGSWKNRYRALYVVKDGKLVYLGDAMDSKLRGLVFDYLIGRKSLEEILPKEGE